MVNRTKTGKRHAITSMRKFNKATPALRRQLIGFWLLPVISFAAAGACSSIDDMENGEPVLSSAARNSPSVPLWYDSNRVQAHVRLPLKRHPMDKDYFSQTSERAKSLGANVLVRHIKSAGETPVWLDEIDAEASELSRASPDSPLPLLFESANRAGLHTIAYYWHITNDALAEKHPEWVCRDEDGRPQENRRGKNLDITGPYKHWVSRSLLQAAAAGADGFYFDFRHLPPGTCLGTRLESAYKEKFGTPPPKTKDKSPNYLRWRQFRASEMAGTFHFWMQTVQAQFPETVFIISATSLPGLTTPEMSTALVSLSPAKTEFRNSLRPQLSDWVFERNVIGLAVPDKDIRIAAGWAVMRDASGGLPPHVWAPSFPNKAHALGFAASVVAHGGIANMNIADELLTGNPVPAGKTPAAALQSAFEFGNRVSPYLRGTRQTRWAAVHFSEYARDQRWPDYGKAWVEVLWPFTGAYGALLRSGVPVGVINDDQLAADRLDDYEVLVITNPQDLNRKQKAAIKAFKGCGGKIVENRREWQWHKRSENGDATAAFIERMQPHLASAPIRITGTESGLHGVAYQRLIEGGRQWIFALTPDFSWVQDVLPRQTLAKQMVNPPPSVSAGISINIHNSEILDLSFDEISAVDAMTGDALEINPTDDGLQVLLPPFRLFSLAVITVAEETANP
jgi:hypothetical protein